MLPESFQQDDDAFFSPQSLLIAIFFFLPLALPGLFGWLNILLAVPVFCLLKLNKNVTVALKNIRNGLLLSAVGALLLDQFLYLVFSLAMLPLGFSLYKSSLNQDTPAAAGAKGIAILTLSWGLFWVTAGIITGENPYMNLLKSLDASFVKILELYRSNSSITAEMLLKLETILHVFRQLLPKILPGMLAVSVVLTVWLNLVIGNHLLLRLSPENAAWPEFKRWQLPDKMIWLLIGAVTLSLFGTGQLKNLGYSLSFVAGVIYLIQGLAIFIHFLDHWKVPRYFRILLYVFLAFQSYGLIILMILGVADIWFDLRKLNIQQTDI